MTSKTLAISHMSSMGMKYYHNEASMIAATEQATQYEGQVMMELDQKKFWRKQSTSTASLNDYVEILSFNLLSSSLDSIQFTRGALSDRRTPGVPGAAAGDIYLDSDDILYVSTGRHWIEAVKNNNTGIKRWNPTAVYTGNDIVVYQGNLFRNTTGGNSATQSPMTDSTNWVPITKNNTVTKYEGNKRYLKGQKISLEGIVYEALADTTEIPSENSPYWQVVSDALYALPRYSAVVDYSVNDYINHDGKIYMNITGANPGLNPDSDTVNWQLKFGGQAISAWDSEVVYPPGSYVNIMDSDMGKVVTYISMIESVGKRPLIHDSEWLPANTTYIATPVYNPTATYLTGDIINYRGVLYKNCYGTYDANSNPEMDTLNWWPIDFKDYVAWQASLTYLKGQKVYYNGHLYKSLTNHTNNTVTPDSDNTNWEFYAGFEGEKAFAPIWDSEEVYFQQDSIFYNENIYVNVTGVNSGHPASDSDNWQKVEWHASGWDSDTVYNINDIVYMYGAKFINLTGAAEAGMPMNDGTNWQLYFDDIKPGLRHFDTAHAMKSHVFGVPGDLAYVKNTNSIWLFTGYWNAKPLVLLDHEYSAVDIDYLNLNNNFPPAEYTQHEAGKVVDSEGTVEKYFAYNNLWRKLDEVDVGIYNVATSRWTNLWTVSSTITPAPLGSMANITGTNRPLVEMEHWDPSQKVGSMFFKTGKGSIRGDVNRVKLSLEAYPDFNYGVSHDISRIYKMGQISNTATINTLFGQQFTTWPDGTTLPTTAERITDLPTNEVFMSFGDNPDRWKLVASSSEVIFDSEYVSTTYTNHNVADSEGNNIDLILLNGVPSRRVFHTDGAFYFGCMQSNDSDENLTGANWIPSKDRTGTTFADPDPTITITKETDSEFWFFGLRGQFCARLPDSEIPVDSEGNSLSQWVDSFGGHPNKIHISLYDQANLLIEEINLGLLDDSVREMDPDNTNVTAYFFEGVQYVDLNNRLMQATRNPSRNDRREVREGIKCARVVVRFTDWLDDGLGDAFWHRDNFKVNWFAPIVSSDDAPQHGTGSLIFKQYIRTGTANIIPYYEDLASNSSWTLVAQSYPYYPNVSYTYGGSKLPVPYFRT